MITERARNVALGKEEADLVVQGDIVNPISLEVVKGSIAIVGDMIVGVSYDRLSPYRGRERVTAHGKICPGFIDAHIHIESSCLRPREFIRAVGTHGTTAVVTDPHEIANVLGEEGIQFMMDDSRGLPMKGLPVDVFFMYPSCVPATRLETSGCKLGAVDILTSDLWEEKRLLGLAEVMNFPHVVNGDPEFIGMIEGLKGHPIDGHCPGLTGDDLNSYVLSGVGSDHECITKAEMQEKIRLGMHIFIREGSVTKNLRDLLPGVGPAIDRYSFCSDDRLPHELVENGHLNHTLRLAVEEMGMDYALAVRFLTYNTARYFGLKNRGAIAPGYKADLAIMDANFDASMVIKNGKISSVKGTYSRKPIFQEMEKWRMFLREVATYPSPLISTTD